MSRRENSLRDTLRRETADAHARVDAAFGSCDLATEAGYVRFLTAQAAAWETLRPILDQGSLARADALREDLDKLDAAMPAPVADIVLPEAASIGHAYVLEGSRLGSTVLMRNLSAVSPGLAERAGSYLKESEKIDAWKQLSIRLQKHDDDHGSDARAVEDALFTFGLFERAWRATAGH